MPKSSKGNPWKTYKKRKNWSDVKEFKFVNGENVIRICPARDDSETELPFFEFSQRWIAVRNNDKNLPIDNPADEVIEMDEVVDNLWEEHNKLKDSGKYNDESPELEEIKDRIYSIYGKARFDMNVIKMINKKGEYVPERDDDDKIVIRRFTAGRKIFGDIKELAASEKWGDCADPDSGYELIITKKAPKGKGQYTQYTVMPNNEFRALTDEELKAFHERSYNLEEERSSNWTSKKRRFEIMKNAKEPLVRELYERLVGDKDEDDDEPKPKKRKTYEDLEEKEEEGDYEESESQDSQEEESEPEPEKKGKSEEESEPEPEKKGKSEEESEPEEKESKSEAKTGKSGKDNKSGKAKKVSKKSKITIEDFVPENFELDKDEYNDMECKGDHEKDDTGCAECVFQPVCSDFTDALLKKDISPKGKSLKEIEEELNEGSEDKEETEVKSEKKKIPF